MIGTILLKNGKLLLHLINTASNAIGSYLSILIITNLLSVESNSHESVIFTFIFFLVPFYTLSSLNYLFIDIAKSFSDNSFSKYYFLIFFNSILFFIILLVPTLLFVHNIMILVYATILSFFMALTEAQNYFLIFNGDDKRYIIFNIILNVLRVLFSYILLSITFDWNFRILALIFSEVLIVILRHYFTNAKIKFKVFDKTFLLEQLNFGWPLLFGVVFSWFTSEFVKLYYYSNQDEYSAGILNLVTKISNILILISTAYINSEIKDIYSHLRMGKITIHQHILKFSVLSFVLLLFILAIALFMPQIIFGKFDNFPILLLFLVLIGVVLNGIIRLLTLVLEFQKKTLKRSMGIALGSIVSILLLLLFKDTLLINAYGVSYLAANIVMIIVFIIFYYQEKRKLKYTYSGEMK